MGSLLNRNIFLYLCLWGFLALSVDYHQTQMNRLHYTLGIFYNDHFTNWKDGIVYFDLKVRAEKQNLKNLTHLAYAYAQAGDQQRYSQLARQLGARDQAASAYLARLMAGEQRLNVELLPGEAR